MHILYLNSKTFLAREIVNALRKRVDLRVTTASIAEKPAPEGVAAVFEQLKPHLPAIVLSVNNAGYDFAGKLEDLLLGAGCCIANWSTDDPFYERTFYGARMAPSPRRMDFVSEESFVAPTLGGQWSGILAGLEVARCINGLTFRHFRSSLVDRNPRHPDAHQLRQPLPQIVAADLTCKFRDAILKDLRHGAELLSMKHELTSSKVFVGLTLGEQHCNCQGEQLTLRRCLEP